MTNHYINIVSFPALTSYLTGRFNRPTAEFILLNAYGFTSLDNPNSEVEGVRHDSKWDASGGSKEAEAIYNIVDSTLDILNPITRILTVNRILGDYYASLNTAGRS